jgi:hypothetical protein
MKYEKAAWAWVSDWSAKKTRHSGTEDTQTGKEAEGWV